MSTEIWWRLTKPVSRPVPASGPRADPDRNPARVLSAIALASVAAGAINVAAAATVGRGSTQNLAFFSVVAAAQLVWGVVSMAEPGGRASQPGQHGGGLGGAQVVLGTFPGGSGRTHPRPEPALGPAQQWHRDQRDGSQHHGYFVASRRSRQACSQRRQASAQTRQCGMWACRSHSSPQLLQMATQASSSGRATAAS